ncbi:MAG: hypothetical protein V4608_11080 [Bacteroidota bacterium]
MKKLIVIFLCLAVIISCEESETPQPQPAPAQNTPPALTNQGKLMFYSGNSSYGEIKMYIARSSDAYLIDRHIGNITMVPSGWSPTCSTVGWGVHLQDSVGTYFYKAEKLNGTPIQSDYITITEAGCVSIKIGS